MEFLQRVLSPTTYVAMAKELAGNKNVKLANLASGAYISLGKFKAMELERNELRTKVAALAAVVQKNAADAETLQSENKNIKTQYEEKLSHMQLQLERECYFAAAQKESGRLRFSSRGAKQSFLAALFNAKLPLQDGCLLGFDVFCQEYKRQDPLAFMQPIKRKRCRRANRCKKEILK